MALEQLDLFGNPVIVETSKKEKAKLVQQPLFEAVFSENSQNVPITNENENNLISKGVSEPNISSFNIETIKPITEIIITQKETKTEPTEPFVYSDNNIRVKVKVKPPAKKELMPTIATKPVVIETVNVSRTEILVESENVSNTSIQAKRAEPEYVSNLHKRGRKSHKDLEASADLINIPDDDTLNQKLYYGITEVASWFNVNVSQIRFWENEFDILQPRKTKKGDRLFRVADIKNLELIYHLIRQRKFSIEGAKTYLKNNKQTADTNFKLVQSLTKFRSFLLELKANLGT